MTPTAETIAQIEHAAAQIDGSAAAIFHRFTIPPERTRWCGRHGEQIRHDEMRASVEILYRIAADMRAELGMPPL